MATTRTVSALIFIFSILFCNLINVDAKKVNKLPEAFSLDDSDRCTAILVAPGASENGASMTTHNADCAECDWRINKVAAKS